MMHAYYAVLAWISPGALRVFAVYNRATRRQRAKIVVFNPAGELYMVINALGDRRWTLPGGGVDRGETAVHAAARELHEELGLRIAAAHLCSLGTTRLPGYSAPLFVLRLTSAQVAHVRPNRYEIYRAGWYAPNRLPSPLQPLVKEALARLSEPGDLGKMG